MAGQFLYEQFDVLSQFGLINHELPDCIKKNLKPNFGSRPYQIETFSRMIHFLKNDFDGKQPRPYHLLFNMATGSGKTLIMAGAMLYLYEQGYRNFMFFVNSNNIIQKTKDNFLNAVSSKYLFAEKIIIGGEQVQVREVENFDEADEKCLNIKFTTIQQLHIDLNSTKENAVTFDDFQNKKIVLIADEAHHLNAGTKQGELFGTFEDTVQKIHEQCYDNLLLEFTATTDYTDKNIVDKYRNKVLFKYDLSEFRKDGYSKEINLFRSLFNEKYRIIQALILNLYRQELATSHNINLKPVILFKAKKTIAESKQKKATFHKLIENLSGKDIDEVRKDCTAKILQKAFEFFNRNEVTDEEIVHRLKSHFRPENCLSANDDEEAERNQMMLNTLEDENNPIRAIFAVQKLNEGWDVLNLFDIVRMYEDRNEEKNGEIGKTTMAEAQLIGRGARYFPFALEQGQDKFTRKFDCDNDNELKVLEELYYHTKEDSRYISELKKALVESGIYEDENDIEEKHLKLKDTFKKSEFYLNAHVVYNLKVQKNHSKVKSLSDLKVRKTDIEFTLSSGKGAVQNVWTENATVETDLSLTECRRKSVKEMPFNVVRFALTTNPFFYFSNLVKFCPNIKSADDFIKQDEYLGGFGVTFNGDKTHCDNITNADYLQALKVLLKSIETEIKQNDVEYEGSEFTYGNLRDKFTDKTLHINKKINAVRADGQENFLVDKDWYVYNANFGTSEEKNFVKMFAARFEKIKEKFSDIYLIRNEQTLKIYDEFGRAFEPDFVLFCCKNGGEENVLQIFIEPKGGHLESKDKWKEEFLKQISDKNEVVKIGTDHYKITGVPFYNYNNENEFAKELESVLT
ncbi:MAG: DEAD/DEAH box helicase family protein [Bacteroidales bacterium]|nr:DEAD/DEAH box helicase family protein [Bacteroidales bacterium]